MSGSTSQPNLNSIVAALQHTPRDTRLDLEALNECSDYWETVREYLHPFDTAPEDRHAPRSISTKCPAANTPISREQAASMGLGASLARDRRHLRRGQSALRRHREGDAVQQGRRRHGAVPDDQQPDARRCARSSTKSTISRCPMRRRNVTGVSASPGRLAEETAENHPARRSSRSRAAPAQAAQRRFRREDAASSEKKVGHAVSRDDLLSYLLYPEVFLEYDKFRQTYADVSVLPTPPFFYGLQSGEEIAVEIEPGKTLIIKFLTTGEPHPDGTRTVFFELNGQPREVNVRDRALRVVERTHPKADPADPGQVGAPTAGVISGIAVQANQAVERGAKLLTLEAMKMQSNIYAPISGQVAKLLVSPGQHVEAKDLARVNRSVSNGQLRKHEKFPLALPAQPARPDRLSPARLRRTARRGAFPVLYLHDGQNLFDRATSVPRAGLARQGAADMTHLSRHKSSR